MSCHIRECPQPESFMMMPIVLTVCLRKVVYFIFVSCKAEMKVNSCAYKEMKRIAWNFLIVLKP